MAKVAIRFGESALVDLESLRIWYTKLPEVGERLLAEIVESITVLADHPDMGWTVFSVIARTKRPVVMPASSAASATRTCCSSGSSIFHRKDAK